MTLGGLASLGRHPVRRCRRVTIETRTVCSPRRDSRCLKRRSRGRRLACRPCLDASPSAACFTSVTSEGPQNISSLRSARFRFAMLRPTVLPDLYAADHLGLLSMASITAARTRLRGLAPPVFCVFHSGFERGFRAHARRLCAAIDDASQAGADRPGAMVLVLALGAREAWRWSPRFLSRIDGARSSCTCALRLNSDRVDRRHIPAWSTRSARSCPKSEAQLDRRQHRKLPARAYNWIRGRLDPPPPRVMTRDPGGVKDTAILLHPMSQLRASASGCVPGFTFYFQARTS